MGGNWGQGIKNEGACTGRPEMADEGGGTHMKYE